ncbi:MAG: hypothetical protein ABSF32_01790 [Ignavibacteria bacterium]|jgi:hypothetical protein
MRSLIQTLVSILFTVFFVLSAKAQDKPSSKLIDVDAFNLGDTCKVRMLDGREIYGVLVIKGTNTIQLVDKHVNNSIAINEIFALDHYSNIIQVDSAESQTGNHPSYRYYIHLKDQILSRCDPLTLTGDTLLISNSKYGNKKLNIDDINTVIKVNRSYSWEAGIIGGVVGLGLGYLISHAIAYSDYHEPVPGTFYFDLPGLRDMTIACGMILGTATGAVIGALIGASFGKDDIYSLDNMNKLEKIRQLRKIVDEK